MTSLLLTGYAISSMLAAGLAMAMYASGSELRQIFDFLLGGLGGSSWARLAVAAPLVIGAALAIQWRAGALDGLHAGRGDGCAPRRERRPGAHDPARPGLAGDGGGCRDQWADRLRRDWWRRTRSASWLDRRRAGVIPLSALAGAILLVGADLIARLLGDIPVGVVTALVGAPIFIWLLARSRSAYEG